jgi:murein L,D-transpeptidase YcbB/YkuD
LLSDNPDWDATRIETTVAGNQETRVNLRARVPVHVLYFTAINEERAGIRFLDDIYQRDDAILAGLRLPPG